MAFICVHGNKECNGCGACFDEPKIVAYCTDCQDLIYVGDNCLLLGDTYYCELCLQNRTLDEILALLGFEISVAS